MTQNYTVLARKYRPTTINELKGQEVLVTSLSNAFTTGRIAHAFLLSGVRGVGKTTTARILAKALNCTGEDGNGNITLNPCNKCSNCIAINSDHHLDVLEMDAASKTGIDDIREIIETVKYKPSTARYKVYIIDEVHMLSKSAFNALLKTLEEPPAFVKFIFATTEIKKVPITIISRCQRFDLRRLTPLELQEHLANICIKENISFEDNALLLVANAAEGSVRDSLSILDQAINTSAGNLTESTIVELLGKGSKDDIYALFSAVTSNNGNYALELLNKLYNNGIELIAIFEELLEICHLITMLKTTVPQASLDNFSNGSSNKLGSNPVLQNLYLTAKEEEFAITLAKQMSLNGLVVLWQLLIKGIEELKISLLPKKAAEMLIVRIAWVNEIATLPILNNLLNKENKSLLETTNIVKNNIAQQENSNPTAITTNNKESVTKEGTAYNTTNITPPTPTNKPLLNNYVAKENTQDSSNNSSLTNTTVEPEEFVFKQENLPNNTNTPQSNSAPNTNKEVSMEEILELFPGAKPLNTK